MAGTLATFARDNAERFGEAVAIRWIRPCRWTELTYAQLAEHADAVANGLTALGVRPGERMALLAETRVEWIVCDQGISAAGAIPVPIYPTGGADDCHWVLCDSAATVLICENPDQVAKIARE